MIGRRARFWAATGLLTAGSVACSDHDRVPTGDESGAAGATNEPWTSEPRGECGAVEQHFVKPSATHVEACSHIEYPMSPPVYGDHYPSWAAYQTYDYPVPLGYLVHGLEHGAVVIFYDCPEGCADEIAQAQAFIDEMPADPRCSEEVKNQVILVPKPNLGARWAAAAWGYSLVADCFDASTFGEFYEDHVGRGPEDLCNQGVVIAAEACE